MIFQSKILFAGSLGLKIKNGQARIAALDGYLKSLDRILDSQKSFRSKLGVKEIESPTYEVDKDYKRYNHKHNMVMRSFWDKSIKKAENSKPQNIRNLVLKNVSGFTLIEKALMESSKTIQSFGTYGNQSNSGFLSWSPLKEPTFSSLKVGRLDQIDNTKMSRLIKKVALWFGASLARITLLDRRWVYSHWYDYQSSPNRNPPIAFSDEKGFEDYSKPSQLDDGTLVIPKKMKYVIALGFEMDHGSMRTAPTNIAHAGTRMYGYRKITQTVASLAEFIRGLGYNAIPSANDTALSVPIAIDAGLGEDARWGGIITPEYGPRLRLAKIITDLPLIIDKPVTFNLHDFCDQCLKCAKECPSRAIPFGKRTTGADKNDVGAPNISESTGSLRWIKNSEKCKSYWTIIGTNCGICIRVCPWNKPASFYHSLATFFAVRGGSLIRRILIKLDDSFGFGKHMKPVDWWGEKIDFSIKEFDSEDMNY